MPAPTTEAACAQHQKDCQVLIANLQALYTQWGAPGSNSDASSESDEATLCLSYNKEIVKCLQLRLIVLGKTDGPTEARLTTAQVLARTEIIEALFKASDRLREWSRAMSGKGLAGTSVFHPKYLDIPVLCQARQDVMREAALTFAAISRPPIASPLCGHFYRSVWRLCHELNLQAEFEWTFYERGSITVQEEGILLSTYEMMIKCCRAVSGVAAQVKEEVCYMCTKVAEDEEKADAQVLRSLRRYAEQEEAHEEERRKNSAKRRLQRAASKVKREQEQEEKKEAERRLEARRAETLEEILHIARREGILLKIRNGGPVVPGMALESGKRLGSVIKECNKKNLLGSVDKEDVAWVKREHGSKEVV